jgi:hypothetical protein
MVAMARNLYEELNSFYPDVRLKVENWLPILISDDGQFIGMGALTVLENYILDKNS